jgi:hypothetical protein
VRVWCSSGFRSQEGFYSNCMHIKIGHIELGDWEIIEGKFLHRSSLTTNGIEDYVGFFARTVRFGSFRDNTLWQPSFCGSLFYLRDLYYKTLDLHKTWLFPLSKVEETMKYMDNFLIRMSGLTVFV